MTWTRANWHFHQDVYRSSSVHLIDERQEVEQTTDALNLEVRWLQLQDNVLIWQTEHQDQCINSLS